MLRDDLPHATTTSFSLWEKVAVGRMRVAGTVLQRSELQESELHLSDSLTSATLAPGLHPTLSPQPVPQGRGGQH
jgi:hypothetical protein